MVDSCHRNYIYKLNINDPEAGLVKIHASGMPPMFDDPMTRVSTPSTIP